ncbi:MAG: kinase-like domain-containing protein [Olpidium bornovanus]|uniref:Serine/threonine-protein kinase TEL1 n=1 Tax=Olpidium bornovanus TaxID=278681 RepID=A0A8H7ZVZ6_9FUNG|nr:MAG: kinase-like domain-containing protein [Olpidium bornovanus]
MSVYRQITQKFKPVFRYFSFEEFPDPVVWYEKRLAYTRSVASNSITGCILGLGDRHSQNILLDKRSAEVVHIDLGIAFDQGKLLPTPELVPFRLTRDIVDGMGSASGGVEGVFRRCCEKTLRVLRDPANATILMTILEVFKHDPLHSWTLSPLKAKRIQERSSGTAGADADQPTPASDAARGGKEEVNKEAERALRLVKNRLANDASVECQVNELIETATNEDNLCRMFPGMPLLNNRWTGAPSSENWFI